MKRWFGLVLCMVLSPAPAKSWMEFDAAASVLDPKEAFRFEIGAALPGQVDIQVHVEEGYALYREHLRFAVPEGAIRSAQVPQGEPVSDPELGKVQKLRGDFVIRLQFAGPAPAHEVLVRAQGCADIGVCFVPTTFRVPIDQPLG